MCYVDFLLAVEDALRENIAVFEDEEYFDIAERITNRLLERFGNADSNNNTDGTVHIDIDSSGIQSNKRE